VSERFPVCTAQHVIRVLRKHGFALVSQKGSHQKWRHLNGRQVIVAMHGNKQIPIGTLTNHHQRSGFNCRRFPLKQIRGLADDCDFRLVDSPGTNFSSAALTI